VIQVIADGVDSSPANIKSNKLLSENGYDSEVQRRLLATNINHHFWDVRGQSFAPWLNPADTDQDQLVDAVVQNVQNRHPRAKRDDDTPPP
jgi:hypothetical protein